MRIAVLDAETTGFPGLAKQDLFYPVEFSAFLVDGASGEVNVKDYFHAVFQVPEHALCHEKTQRALTLSGEHLGPIVREHGRPAVEVMDAWVQWAERQQVSSVTAFNSSFDRQVLPWIQQPWGRCLMRWTRALAFRLDPEYTGMRSVKTGGWKVPNAHEAKEWARSRGYEVPDFGEKHRALADAAGEAFVLKALLRMDPFGYTVA